jgi:predicted DNA-binding transcriptional regulator YafY
MDETPSPTARAIRALDILRLHPGISAEDLAERLGVTERAARRYVATLRDAGVAIEGARGPSGGYRLGRGTTLAPIGFTEEEALGLVLQVLNARPAAGRDDDLIGGALHKVVRALPEAIGRQAALLRERAAATPDPFADQQPDPLLAHELITSIGARRGVLLEYRSEAGTELTIDVDPWSVVGRGGRWYLLCYSHHVDAVRTYRIDRIRSVQRTTRRFEPPVDLDPVAALGEHLGTGWRYPTRVVFAASVEQVQPWLRPPMGRLEPHEDGCVLIGTTSAPAMYAREWLSVVPFPFRVEGGTELRAAVAEVAEQFGAALGDQQASSEAPEA